MLVKYVGFEVKLSALQFNYNFYAEYHKRLDALFPRSMVNEFQFCAAPCGSFIIKSAFPSCADKL